MIPPLTMTATVRRGGRATDATLACYWWSFTTWQNRQGVAALADVDSEHILLDHGTDIAVGDTVVGLTDHLGRTVFGADAFRVVDVITYERSHLDCTLRYGRVGGGRY